MYIVKMQLKDSSARNFERFHSDLSLIPLDFDIYSV